MEHKRSITAIAVVLTGWLISGLAFADIYTWVDEHGVTHYSTIRPAGRQPQVYPTDPAFKAASPSSAAKGAPRAAPVAEETAEQQALRNRVELLEAMLDQERGARVDDLKSQLENERGRVRQLEAERTQWSEIGGLWSTPAAFSGGWVIPTAPVIAGPGHGKPGKSGSSRIKSDGGRIPYPSLSGPSANFPEPSRR